MKIIVTGGAGFIGSHLVDRLCGLGHEVVVVDSLDPVAHGGPPDHLHPDATYLWQDVRDEEVWREVLPGADAVSHQAAKVGLGVDLGDIEKYVEANDVGTATMLHAMHGVGWAGRLVLASSMVVYGEGRYDCELHGHVRPGPRQRSDLEAGRYEPRCPECGTELRPAAVDETAPVDPRNVYAATKLHQEHLCAAWAREAGTAVCALRYHNVYGARMPRDTPYAGVASIFRSSLAAGTPPRVFEDGAQRRDFVRVEDVARVNELALCSYPDVSGAFNVASGHPITLLEMALVLCAADGRGIEPEVVGEFRLGDVRHVVGDAQRARRALGFDAEIGPQEGLERFATEPLRAPTGSP